MRVENMMRFFKYIIILFLLSSCTINKYTWLLQENDRLPQYAKAEMERYRIQVDDEVRIRVLSMNKEVADIFNAGNSAGANNSGNTYRVYTDGTIDLPFINGIHIEGLTLSEAKEEIQKRMKTFIVDAEVIVALSNNYFYVLGDAGKGGFLLYKEKITIYQALAMSGGIHKVGNKKNVYIMRKDAEGKTQVRSFDIRSITVLDSEYYYVQPNDIIYVPPAGERFFKLDSFASIVGVISTSLSLFFLIYGITKM
jgi:polysaccharide export outer membrane protein